METKCKENALNEWTEQIKQSWTWKRLTQKEKDKFLECIPKHNINGSFDQRWSFLDDLYSAFLQGTGYDPFDWRESPRSNKNLMEENMTQQEFEQYVFENYTIDENPMAREIFQNLLILISTFPSEWHYELLCEYIPQVEERIIRRVEL